MASGLRCSVAALLVVAGCSSAPADPPVDTTAPPAPDAATEAADACKKPTWSYAPPQGVAEGWTNACVPSETRFQSPIVLDPRAPDGRGNVTVAFAGSPLVVTNVGYTASSPLSNGGFMVGSGPNATRLDAYEVHFHAPSEHILKGVSEKPLDFEMHIKTRTVDMQRNVVFAVLFSAENGPDNPHLAPIMNLVSADLPLCREQRPNVPPIQLRNLLPFGPPVGQQPYFYYRGSLTNPPCTGEVEFFVLARPMVVSVAQRDRLQAMVRSVMGLPNNNRDPQNLNNRPVQYFTY